MRRYTPTHRELLPDVQQGIRSKLESYYISAVLIPAMLCRKQRILLAQSGDYLPQDRPQYIGHPGSPEDPGTAKTDPQKQARWTELE